MDAEALLKLLRDGELGDDIRSAWTQEMLDDLASKDYDDDREWADGVADWLRSNWL